MYEGIFRYLDQQRAEMDRYLRQVHIAINAVEQALETRLLTAVNAEPETSLSDRGVEFFSLIEPRPDSGTVCSVIDFAPPDASGAVPFRMGVRVSSEYEYAVFDCSAKVGQQYVMFWMPGLEGWTVEDESVDHAAQQMAEAMLQRITAHFDGTPFEPRGRHHFAPPTSFRILKRVRKEDLSIR
ncbi:Uncharacterised protein [Bordetella ansorpii]|uniref:Uncharacterized protein n=1 Tax=Bordetella ansorpii TaxID=288768 RepID=A0A157RP09_9BORD|nr:hypothetical protein [Bordetella ansorpii]SAI59717.1 Uncharacterised protein [Bordetella ansorpii]